MNNPLKEKIERQLVKKISNPFVIVFFLLPNISKNIICNKQCFFEDMGLLIVKNHLPIQFETFMFTFVSKTCLSFQKTVFTQIFPKLMGKKKQLYVSPTLKKCSCTTLSFDVCMSKGAHDTFVHVINFLEIEQQPKKFTLDFLEVANIFGKTLAKSLINYYKIIT